MGEQLDDARARRRDDAQDVVGADDLWRRLSTLGRKQRADPAAAGRDLLRRATAAR